MESQQKNTPLGSKVNLFFLALIVAGFVYILYQNRDQMAQMKETLRNANYAMIAGALGITIFANVMRSWRWYYLLVPIKKSISFISVLRVNTNAIAANLSTPGKAGVPVKAYLLKKLEGIDYSRSLPSILGEMGLEYAAQFTLLVASIFIGGHLTKLFVTLQKITESQTLIQNILLTFGILGLLGVGFYFFRKKVNFPNFVEKFLGAIRDTGKRWDCWGYSTLITVVNLIIDFGGFWLLLAALGHPEIGLTFIIFAGAITNIIGLLSPFPGGIGAREITIYGLYDLYFSLGGLALLAILSMRILTYLGLFLLFFAERGLARLFHQKSLKEINVA